MFIYYLFISAKSLTRHKFWTLLFNFGFL